MTIITIGYLLSNRAGRSQRDTRSKGRVLVHSCRNLQPFLIPSCGVLNSLLLLLQLFARTSRFSNYVRVAYLTGGICPPLLLCSFLRGPLPPFFCSSYPFELGRKAEPACSKTLRLCSRALAIKRRPITILLWSLLLLPSLLVSERASERWEFHGFFRSNIDRENRSAQPVFSVI